MVKDAAGDWKHWWFYSTLVCKAAELGRLRMEALGLPQWRMKQLGAHNPDAAAKTAARGDKPFMFDYGLDLRPGDFIEPIFRCYAVRDWEYQPGYGTRAPPPTETDPSSWRGYRTWQSAQNLWYELYNDGYHEHRPTPLYKLTGQERRSAWQNALKRYARDVLVWKKEFE